MLTKDERTEPQECLGAVLARQGLPWDWCCCSECSPEYRKPECPPKDRKDV